uniref:Uncharacterized protein n=1 Tax=mine drainage metagenome TaxID=410659 RepID=E6PU92_9ZZZZ
MACMCSPTCSASGMPAATARPPRCSGSGCTSSTDAGARPARPAHPRAAWPADPDDSALASRLALRALACPPGAQAHGRAAARGKSHKPLPQILHRSFMGPSHAVATLRITGARNTAGACR